MMSARADALTDILRKGFTPVADLIAKLKVTRFPVFNPSQLDLIRRVMGGFVNPVREAFNARIRPSDIQTLSPETWLNDEIINFYGRLIMDRSDKAQERGWKGADGRPLKRVHWFNTFFYTKIVANGPSAVRRWTKSVRMRGFSSCLSKLIPHS